MRVQTLYPGCMRIKDLKTEWRIVDDRLEYYRPDNLKAILGDENAWKRVLRDPEIQEVLKKNHEDPDAAHLGRERMYERIKTHYYWPGMYQDVDSYVGQCGVCKKAKYKQSSSKAPFQTRSYPLFLVTDNGREFVNETLKEYSNTVGVKHTPIAVAHPQANPVERINRTIKPMIRSYIDKDQSRWDEHLGEFQLAYNSSYHASLKLSPYFLVHGQEPRLSGKITDLELDDITTENDKWKLRIQRLDELRHKVEAVMRKENERQENYQSKNNSIPEVKVGDEVFYPNRKLSNKSQRYSASLGMKYLGPAIISKIISPCIKEDDCLTEAGGIPPQGAGRQPPLLVGESEFRGVQEAARVSTEPAVTKRDR
ncbi:uncharacterized protein LOC106693992 [Microplitis demolitor]|uniref:uncharacterized protein LOC106693992 n=1 Tax=Microplitis demolitor TaxID=69319 RepID=UPI00235B7061|nr:uncharacterized protein LOC106693992 [Microplitis demolitor]